MPLLDPDLFNFLSEARLVIFKGDLNYRKLLGDFNWNPTDEFQKTLRGTIYDQYSLIHCNQ